jgi:hypothetical protein
MREEIQHEYRLAGVEDPAVAQSQMGQSHTAAAGVKDQPAATPQAAAPMTAVNNRQPAIEAEIEYRTHEL